MSTILQRYVPHAGAQPDARARAARHNAPFQAAIDYYRLDGCRREVVVALPPADTPAADAAPST